MFLTFTSSIQVERNYWDIIYRNGTDGNGCPKYMEEYTLNIPWISERYIIVQISRM